MFFSGKSLATLAGFSATLVSLLVLPSPATAATAGVWEYWSYPQGGNATNPGFYSTEQDLTITQSAPHRYWAHYWRYHGVEAGYMGLQTTVNGKVAIFSIWNSTEATPGGPTVECTSFGHEGSGKSCMMPFEWSVGTTYHMRVYAVGPRPSGSILWRATLQETTGEGGQPVGSLITIGYIWAHPVAGYITSSDSWIENFGVGPGGCRDEVPAQATFTMPKMNDGSVTATYGVSKTEFCSNDASHSSRNMHVPGGVILFE